MPKDKVETSSQLKTKTNNALPKQSSKSKVPSTSKNEEIKKTRELSTDRSNVKKTLTSQKPSTKKVESSRLKPNETPKTRTVSNTTTTRMTTNRNVLKTNTTDKINVSNVTPRTSLSTKPVKTSSTTLNSSRSVVNLPLKGTTKSTARDITSKRVTKEQFFPKKYPFSSYLHEEEKIKSDRKNVEKPTTKTVKKVEEHNLKSSKKNGESLPSEKLKIEESLPSKKLRNEESIPSKKLSKERTLTRTLNPSEVEVIKNIVKETENTNSRLERPRTATIRKHFEVNDLENSPETISNISQIDSGNFSREKTQDNEETSEENNDYEDDFDSYESDFEAYSSSSTSDIEINSSISGSSTSSSSSEERLTELTQKRVSSAGTEEERKLDSGNYDLPDMKHKQILDKIKEAVEKENLNLSKIGDTLGNLASLSDEGFEDGSKHSLVNTGFINFKDAKKKQKLKKLNTKSRKRGDDLMEMIRLNNVSFSLFDMKAISYDEFMQSYGKTGTIQMSAQTGDDDIDEEIQTEQIKMLNKSTQYPIRFSKLEEELNIENDIKWGEINSKQLDKFMGTTGKFVLHILEEKQIKNEQTTKKNEQELPFSDGYFSLNFDNVPFLKNRIVSHMTYSKYSKLLTVHESNIQISMDQNNQLLSRSSICVWDISEPKYPINILVSSGNITKACFDSNFGFLIFAGICDGSVSVWDLREDYKLHRLVYDEKTDKTHILRSPTYTTVSVVDSERNSSKIISVESYFENLNQSITSLNSQHNISGIQVATLDETGLIVIWSVIQKQATPELLSEDQGLIPWGCVLLVQGLTINLQKINPNLKELQCFDLQFSNSDFNHLFVASNYGVLHCLTSGMKPKPKIYSTDKSSVKCVEMAPFSPTHFLAGCENGNIKLHSRFYEKPLITLCSTEQNKIEETIQIIEWSNSRPCVFFVKDKSNFVHIWDLSASDMFPIYSIPFVEQISDIKFLSFTNNTSQSCYLAIATKDYGVRIHSISKEFSQISSEQYRTELNIFLNYANRL